MCSLILNGQKMFWQTHILIYLYNKYVCRLFLLPFALCVPCSMVGSFIHSFHFFVFKGIMNNLLQTQLRRNGIYMRANVPNFDDWQNGKIHILLVGEEMCGDGHGQWPKNMKRTATTEKQTTMWLTGFRCLTRSIGNIGDRINSF